MSAEELKTKGNAALQAENFEEAVKFYTEGIEIDAKNHILYSNRSAAFAKMNKNKEALEDAEQTIALKSDWPKGYSRKGAALEQLNKYDEAIQTYEEGLTKDPNNEALQSALKACKDNAEMPPMMFGGGGGGGMPGGAFNPFADPNMLANLAMNPKTRDILKDPEVLALISGLQKNPQDIGKLLSHPKASVLLGALLGGMGGMGGGMGGAGMFGAGGDDDDDAPMDFDSKENGKPNVTTKPMPKEEKPDPMAGMSEEQKSAEREKELGTDAYKKRDFETALIHYKKAAELCPTVIAYLTNQAAVYFEQANYEECIKTCESAIEIGRENKAEYTIIAKAFARIGNAYHKLNDLKKAIKYFDHSLSEHRNPDILKKKNQIEKFLKEEEAKAYINPEEAEKEKNLGNEAFKKADFPTAMKHYNEAIRREPTNAKILRNRAACYSKLMEFPSALKDCDEAIKIDPLFVKAYVQKGAIHAILKEPSKAQAAYAKAIEIDPECGEAIDGYRSCVMESSSNPEEARKRAMQDPEVQEILRDPAMRLILEQMQTERHSVQEHLKNPEVKAKIQKLIEAGLIQVR